MEIEDDRADPKSVSISIEPFVEENKVYATTDEGEELPVM